MFRYTSLALLTGGLLILGVEVSAAAPCQPQAITTAAAYQSWLAWYQIHSSAPADADGPRFKQLLAAADGDQYFLKGLDDSSPQVRELSQQGLIQSLTRLSYHELNKRLSSLDAHVCQQAQTVLAARADHRAPEQSSAAMQAGIESGSAAREWLTHIDSSQRPRLGPSFHWGVPLGGMMRIALGNHSLDKRECPENVFDQLLGSDLVGLTSVVEELQRPLTLSLGTGYYQKQERLKRLKRLLAETQRRQESHASAAKVLELLSQTTQSSPLDDIQVEQLKQALAVHVGRPMAATDGQDASSRPLWHSTYRLRIDIERLRGKTRDQSTLDSQSAPAAFAHGQSAANMSLMTGSIAALQTSDEAVDLNQNFADTSLQLTSSALPRTWVSCPLSDLQSLTSGTYKLLLTFESPLQTPFGVDGTTLQPAKVGAIVFRVKGVADAAATSHSSIEPNHETSPGDSAAWQVLQVAISNSTISWDDLCIPAPSTFAQHTGSPSRQPREQVINFMGPMGR